MGAVNRVFLMGNLTRDPTMRKTASGLAVSDLGLAVSDKYRNKAGELVESTCFAEIVVWGKQAETCGQYLAKGAPVMVEGRLELDQWETPTGEKRSRLRVRGDRIQFLGRPQSRGGTTAVADGTEKATVPVVAVEAEESDKSGEMPF